jgi:uncharacterized protein DUF6894
MAHYFFDVHYERPLVDEIGEELADDDAAWHEATVIAGELFSEIDGRFRPEMEWRLEVRNQQRAPLYVIRIHAETFPKA